MTTYTGETRLLGCVCSSLVQSRKLAAGWLALRLWSWCSYGAAESSEGPRCLVCSPCALCSCALCSSFVCVQDWSHRSCRKEGSGHSLLH
jgi:hypothetical protein